MKLHNNAPPGGQFMHYALNFFLYLIGQQPMGPSGPMISTIEQGRGSNVVSQ